MRLNSSIVCRSTLRNGRILTRVRRTVSESTPVEEGAKETVETDVASAETTLAADEDSDDDFGPMPVSVQEQGIANKKRRGISHHFPHFL